MKICSTCKQGKSLGDFYAGYARCKKCHYEATEKWRKANVMRSRAACKKYAAKNPTICKASRLRAKANWKKNNPVKYYADNVACAAIRDGKIARQPCAVCKQLYKTEIKAHAHHCDYSKPLDVMWLCPSHHKAWHRVFVPEGI